jgi:hypothetical protein
MNFSKFFSDDPFLASIKDAFGGKRQMNLEGEPFGGAGQWSGSGSGLYAQTALTAQQRSRSLIIQDTRRSLDLLTWRKQLAYGRQLYVNIGEIRGAIQERAMFANSGGWTPRAIGKNTPSKVRDQYEEFLWDWMKVCDIRGHPYNFWENMRLASVMVDRAIPGSNGLRTIESMLLSASGGSRMVRTRVCG